MSACRRENCKYRHQGQGKRIMAQQTRGQQIRRKIKNQMADSGEKVIFKS
jgi:hypothetical protein